MTEVTPTKTEGLPENARRPLEAGEQYVPLIPDQKGVCEVADRSVTLYATRWPCVPCCAGIKRVQM